jgi:hypothetical protein
MSEWTIHKGNLSTISDTQFWFSNCFDINIFEVKKLLFPPHFMVRMKYWKFKPTDLEDIFDLILEEKYQEAIYGFHVSMKRYRKMKRAERAWIDKNGIGLTKQFLFDNLSQEYCNYRMRRGK